MPIELKTMDDVFKLHQQVEGQLRKQLQQLRSAPEAKLAAATATLLDEPLEQARAVLAQAQRERQLAVQRLDERVKSAQEALDALETGRKNLRSSVGTFVADAGKARGKDAGRRTAASRPTKGGR